MTGGGDAEDHQPVHAQLRNPLSAQYNLVTHEPIERNRVVVMANRENIRKWVDALRSGEFKQGRKALRRDDGYCCLGVACELYRRENYGEWDGSRFTDGGGDRSGFFLPDRVVRWLGVSSRDPMITGGGRVSGLNDDGADFLTIADLIEREWLAEDS